MGDLSVVIVTYNPGEVALACLDALYGMEPPPHLDVIVVDNASSDSTVEHLAQNYPDVLVVTNSENRGFAAASNQGVALASGRYVLLLNPDVIVHRGALAEMVAFLEDNPTVGIVGPRTFDGEGQVALTARPPYSVATVLGRYLGLGRLLPNLVWGRHWLACRRASAPFDVGWVQGSCLMLRREVHKQTGGLDEGFFLFAEEADFCERALEAGWRVCFLPTASVTHYESSSVSRYVQTKVRSHHLSPLYYFRKRGRKGAVLALKIGFTVELLMKIVIRLFQMMWHRDEVLRLRVRTYWAVLGESWRY